MQIQAIQRALRYSLRVSRAKKDGQNEQRNWELAKRRAASAVVPAQVPMLQLYQIQAGGTAPGRLAACLDLSAPFSLHVLLAKILLVYLARHLHKMTARLAEVSANRWALGIECNHLHHWGLPWWTLDRISISLRIGVVIEVCRFSIGKRSGNLPCASFSGGGSRCSEHERIAPC